jgi:hypothetical protein
MKSKFALALAAASAVQIGAAPVFAGGGATLPAGSRLYLALDEGVSSARGEVDVGSMVRCRVWRDVEDRGVVFIKSGAPATCRVDKVKRRNMAGTEGSLSIGGVETRSVDGQMVALSGGYHKEGSGHKAVVWTVGILLLWPALFVPGGNAELPPGTVFDVSTVNDVKLDSVATPKTVNLAGLMGSASDAFSADFMLEDFMNQPKHDTFRIKVTKGGEAPTRLVVDSVNGKSIPAIPLTLGKVETNGDDKTVVAEVGAKTLAKHFARGINRFEVAYDDGGRRKAAEVVMDVQM